MSHPSRMPYLHNVAVPFQSNADHLSCRWEKGGRWEGRERERFDCTCIVFSSMRATCTNSVIHCPSAASASLYVASHCNPTCNLHSSHLPLVFSNCKLYIYIFSQHTNKRCNLLPCPLRFSIHITPLFSTLLLIIALSALHLCAGTWKPRR